MSSNKVTEGVGKKIVEALKNQASDIDIIPVPQAAEDDFSTNENIEANTMQEEIQVPNDAYDNLNNNVASALKYNDTASVIDTAFNNTIMNFRQNTQDLNMAAVDDMELPSNVAVLKKLITKLPSGVSKQTGALIIKQTMEALGISMTNVLQEAQQVQENLTQSVRDCQNNVLEYKKQINVLEVQAQKYQRQFAAINDIISLFIQTGN